jgi:hypothetical protein
MAQPFSERHRLLHRRRRMHFWRRFALLSGWLLGVLFLAALVSAEAGLVLK